VGIDLQIRHGKGFIAKIVFLNELAPEGSTSPRGFLAFLYCFKYSGLRVTNLQLDLVLFVGFRWFWGLTCDFWAENGERKIMATTISIE
jgi:hypothetical protein